VHHNQPTIAGPAAGHYPAIQHSFGLPWHPKVAPALR
jgi:hypothetical protein